MLEAILVVPMQYLQPADDMIDVYEGVIPPSMTFQVVDVDTPVIEPETGE